MAISVGNALGAFTRARTAEANPQGEKNLLDFINGINKYGIAIKARFELNFSGIENITFYVTDINTPEVRQNFGNVYFEGKVVEIPVNIEYGHDFQMTMLNDNSGMLYSNIKNWMMNQDSGESLINSGYTMTLRSLGDGVNYDGMTITLNGVRIKSVSGLSFNTSDAGISTFNIGVNAISFEATMGKLQKISGYAGALKSLLKGAF